MVSGEYRRLIMLKSELIELIKDMDDSADIDEVVSPQYLNIDNIKNISETNKDIKSWLDSEKDKHSSKATKTAIENFKKKDMQKLIDAKVLELTGDNETPEQKRIKELELKFAEQEKATKKAQMVSKFKDVLNEKRIPSNMIDFLLSDDEDVTNANISLFEESMVSYINNKVNERVGGTKDPQPRDREHKKYTMEDLSKMTPEEINANWDLIQGR